MAYPASTATLAKWMSDVDQRAMIVKSEAQSQSSMSSGSTLNMDMVRRFYDLLKASNFFFGQAAEVPGLADYVTAQKQNAVSDPVAEFTAMVNAIRATIDWLNTNVPSGTFGSNTYKLGFSFPVDYTTPATSLTFTAGQTATYRTALATLIATIG